MRKHCALLLIAATAVWAASSGADARQARRRDRQQEQVAELDTGGLSPAALQKFYLGAWGDLGGRRQWFSIDAIDGDQVQRASFPMAHLKTGHIEGNQLTLVSMSCVPLIGCYSYTIRGKLLANARMDMRATDDAGETVHFVLVRK